MVTGAQVLDLCVRATTIAFLVALLGCDGGLLGSSTEDPEKCYALADSTYSPRNYLAWRDSRSSRFSSITLALPCSAYVKSSPSTLPISDVIRECDAKRGYYTAIGKYDQFVSGWEDVYDLDTGNRVEFSQIDSAENFQSDIRLQYERCRDNAD
jgi:hypothetical protein